MAIILFLDDSRQRQCARERTGPLLAVGGIAISDDLASQLDAELSEICVRYHFPPGEIFKWSPSNQHWMRDNLVGDRRQSFFRAILQAVARHGGTGLVVVSDESKSTAVHQEHEFDVLCLALERFQFGIPREQKGIVVVARPSGGRSDEDSFLSGCADLIAEGTRYTNFDKLAMNIVTMPMPSSKILQASDLVVSVTTAMVAGHSSYAAAIFPDVVDILRQSDGRRGGVGLKIHPDKVYLNLYHWLLGDNFFKRGNVGHPLPMKGMPFSGDQLKYN